MLIVQVKYKRQEQQETREERKQRKYRYLYQVGPFNKGLSNTNRMFAYFDRHVNNFGLVRLISNQSSSSWGNGEKFAMDLPRFIAIVANLYPDPFWLLVNTAIFVCYYDVLF